LVIPTTPYPVPVRERYPFSAVDRLVVDTRVPGIALISLTGEHELYGALGLQDRIASLLEDGLSIVIDLTEAVFLDSSIVAVLLKAQTLAAERDCDYSVVLGKTTGEPVRRMFEMTGLAHILPIVERDEAS
jgi:anti-anti-sigma factor